MSRDDRVDAYIAKQAPFAQPILQHLRAVVHRALPDLAEDIKWGRPFFLLGGKPFAMMAGFKAHAIFGFWQMGERAESGREAEAGGQFGRLTSLADLPDEAALHTLIKAAAEARDEPAEPRPKREPKAELETPGDLIEALAGNPSASNGFDKLPPGQRREYIKWILEARRPETRAKRIEKAVAQLAEGKSLNWKYQG